MQQTINILIKDNNIDIKAFLKKYHVGRGKIEEIRNSRDIFVNEQKVDLDCVLKTNDMLKITSIENEVIPYDKEIEVLYEDDNYIAVFKPANILIHSDGQNDKTLINATANYLMLNNKAPIVYPLHRLDYETQGVVIFAKNFLACSIFSNLLENHQVEKKYILMCHGYMSSKQGTLKFFLGKDRHQANKMVVLKNKGQLAITEYKVLKEFDNKSLVLAKILTGKKHQIRVSFAQIKHHLIGDKLYGIKNDLEELKLKAVFLSFLDPLSRERITIDIPNSF